VDQGNGAKDRFQESRFAATVRAHDTNELARPYPEIYIFDREAFAVSGCRFMHFD
jgi:hypothetical protein